MAKKKFDELVASWAKPRVKRRTKAKHLRHSKKLNKHHPDKKKRA